MRRYQVLATLSGLVLCLILVGFIKTSSLLRSELRDEPAPNFVTDDSADTITMVFVPSGDITQTAQAAETLADLLEAETGLTVHPYVAGCYGSAVEALATQNADVGWLSPLAYAYASDNYGIEVILTTVRSGQTYYRSQFLVRSDSGIDTLSDLAGKNFAYVDPLSASGHLYPAMQISETQGISDEEFFSQIFYVGSHNQVVEDVYNGEHDGTPVHGGATYEDARNSVLNEYPDVFTETKVISYSENIPNDTVSVRAGLEQDIVLQLENGLLAVADTQEGKDALEQLYTIDGFAPADDSYYDIIRDYVAFYDIEFATCSEATPVTKESGGTIEYTSDNGHDTTLHISPDAVDQTTQINIAPIPAITNLPSNYKTAGDAFEITAVVSGTTQTVSVLETAYELRVEYDGNDLSDVQEQSLGLHFWEDGDWVKEPSSSVDTINDLVSANPDHFSLWAIMGEKIYAVYLPYTIRNH